MQTRSIAICILLYIVTIFIYQYFWWYAVHRELPSRKGVDDKAGVVLLGFIVPVVVSFAAGFLVAASSFTKFFRILSSPDPDLDQLDSYAGMSTWEIWTESGIWVGALIAATGVFGIYWMFRVGTNFTSRVNQLSAYSGLGERPVSPGLIPALTLCGGVQVASSFIDNIVPAVGGLAVFAAVVLAIVWWCVTQSAVNRIVMVQAGQLARPIPEPHGYQGGQWGGSQ
jgi:hypothetical protein